MSPLTAQIQLLWAVIWIWKVNVRLFMEIIATPKEVKTKNQTKADNVLTTSSLNCINFSLYLNKISTFLV